MKCKTDRKTKADKPLTWEKMVRAEPELRDLLDYARKQERTIIAYRDEDGDICLQAYRAIRCYRDVIKPNVEVLVGWFRPSGPAFLRTKEAYRLAIDTIWAALPDDFDEDEIDEARERAFDLDLAAGNWEVVAGPKAA
jgi:hypothetical protein